MLAPIIHAASECASVRTTSCCEALSSSNSAQAGSLGSKASPTMVSAIARALLGSDPASSWASAGTVWAALARPIASSARAVAAGVFSSAHGDSACKGSIAEGSLSANIRDSTTASSTSAATKNANERAAAQRT